MDCRVRSAVLTQTYKWTFIKFFKLRNSDTLISQIILTNYNCNGDFLVTGYRSLRKTYPTNEVCLLDGSKIYISPYHTHINYCIVRRHTSVFTLYIGLPVSDVNTFASESVNQAIRYHKWKQHFRTCTMNISVLTLI